MHFCKANQNVRKRQNAVFFALQKTKAVQKCIFATHQMHFCTNKMLQMHFGVHFPKENVQLCKNAMFFALQKTKMRTFCNTKCYKCI